MTRVLLHPGFPKSGTTSLQKLVFDVLPGIQAITPGAPGDAAMTFFAALFTPEGFEAPGSDLAKLLVPLADPADPRPIVLSNEGLSVVETMHVAARRLHASFPGAEVVFTVREQLAAVQSLYAKHFTVVRSVPVRRLRGRPVSFEEWLSFQDETYGEHLLDLFEYDRAVRVYAELFGRERVHVLLFEDMKAWPEMFAVSLASLLGQDPAAVVAALGSGRENTARSAAQAWVYRLEERLGLGSGGVREQVPSWIRRPVGKLLAKGGQPQLELPPGWRERLEARYRAGNAYLSDTFGLDLSGAGYAV